MATDPPVQAVVDNKTMNPGDSSFSGSGSSEGLTLFFAVMKFKQPNCKVWSLRREKASPE